MVTFEKETRGSKMGRKAALHLLLHFWMLDYVSEDPSQTIKRRSTASEY
jgi:hypothetical protein